MATILAAHRELQAEIPGAADRLHVMIESANHFIQEDAPEQLVRIIDEFVRAGS